MTDFIIAPSILSADLARLGEEVESVLVAGAQWVHFDVMDNHYVPNLTFGPSLCQALRNYGITAPIDVHLMVTPVDDLIRAFAEAGATSITFHPEASHHVHRSLQLIRDSGCKGGLAFNPATPLDCIPHVRDLLDMILIMSVNPGFGGQAFLPSSLSKIAEAKKLTQDASHPIAIEVDGGISEHNIGEVAEAGATVFVAGSAIFSKGDYSETLRTMKAALPT